MISNFFKEMVSVPKDFCYTIIQDGQPGKGAEMTSGIL